VLVATNVGIHLSMVWKDYPDLLQLHRKAGRFITTEQSPDK
jgi:hypothetical protein